MTGGSGKRIRALIVDDEDLARQVIREMLALHPDVLVAQPHKHVPNQWLWLRAGLLLPLMIGHPDYNAARNQPC